MSDSICAARSARSAAASAKSCARVGHTPTAPARQRRGKMFSARKTAMRSLFFKIFLCFGYRTDCRAINFRCSSSTEAQRNSSARVNAQCGHGLEVRVGQRDRMPPICMSLWRGGGRASGLLLQRHRKKSACAPPFARSNVELSGAKFPGSRDCYAPNAVAKSS